MADPILAADAPQGKLFACVAASRFTVPAVSHSRLTAALHPFPDDASARAALAAAGAVIADDRPAKRRRAGRP
jgi:hypothetical protein